MWQDYSPFIHLFSIQLHSVMSVGRFNMVYPTPHWKRSWQCSFQWRMNWVWWSVPPKTRHRSVLVGWGKTVSCHPGRPDSGEAGAERQNRCRCPPEPPLDTDGWAMVHCTSSPPSGCLAAGPPMIHREGDRGGRSSRGAVGHWEGEAQTPGELWGCCSFPHRPDIGLGLLRQLKRDRRTEQMARKQ